MGMDLEKKASIREQRLKFRFKLNFLFLLVFFYSPIWSVELDPGGNRTEEGVEHFQKQEYVEALREFQKAQSYLGEEPRGDFNRGTAEYKIGDYGRAEKSFRKATEAEDSSLKAKAFFNLGNTYARMGDKKKAAMSYIEALKNDPNLEQARKNLELLRKNNQPPKTGNEGSQESEQSSSEGDDKKDSQNQGQKDKETSKDSNNGSKEKKSSGKESKSNSKSESLMDRLDIDSVHRQKNQTKNEPKVFW